MRTRVAAPLLLLALAGATAGCSDDDGVSTGTARPTTDADCARVVPEDVLTTLGWTATGDPAEATVRGCRREAEQGYVEVRARSGYERLCRTLDRRGGVSAAPEVDWLEGRTACAVEPDGDVGQTKVVVRGEDDAVTEVTVAVLTPTPRAQVRAAVAQLVGAG